MFHATLVKFNILFPITLKLSTNKCYLVLWHRFVTKIKQTSTSLLYIQQNQLDGHASLALQSVTVQDIWRGEAPCCRLFSFHPVRVNWARDSWAHYLPTWLGGNTLASGVRGCEFKPRGSLPQVMVFHSDFIKNTYIKVFLWNFDLVMFLWPVSLITKKCLLVCEYIKWQHIWESATECLSLTHIVKVW